MIADTGLMLAKFKQNWVGRLKKPLKEDYVAPLNGIWLIVIGGNPCFLRSIKIITDKFMVKSASIMYESIHLKGDYLAPLNGI